MREYSKGFFKFDFYLTAFGMRLVCYRGTSHHTEVLYSDIIGLGISSEGDQFGNRVITNNLS